MFGNESAGLSNEEMFACQALVHIPADPAYTSLNLAQAVQVVCYELRMALGAALPPTRSEKPATSADLEDTSGRVPVLWGISWGRCCVRPLANQRGAPHTRARSPSFR